MPKPLSEFATLDFLEIVPDYVTIRDCFKGSRAIKDSTTKYLPQLKGQSVQDYANYLFRALFFPITGKTCTTMVGMATTKPPEVKYPPTMEPYFSDTSSGYQFTETYVRMFTEVLLMGRYGVLIDAPINGNTSPKLVPYVAENIVRWRENGYGRLLELMLREYVAKPTDKKYETKLAVQYRHCVLVEDVYTVFVLDEDLNQVSGIVPTFSGQPIDFIPFVCCGSSGVHMSVDRPPMLDIATINVSHYLSSADLEWGRHITGLPTPVVSGVDSSTNLSIGGTSAWILPPAEAKAYYMEFLGQGLGSLEKAMADKIGLMASVSARLVDNSTRGSEAAETVRLRYMSESASLIHVIGAIESALNLLYNMLAKLLGVPQTVSIQFSREVLGTGIKFSDLKTLFEAYFEGGVSKETLLYNMRRLDAVDPNRSDADELAAIRDPELREAAADTTEE
jgi:hypothetical protein